MAVAIVSGAFAIVLALLSWLLSNGSRRGRLLTRIERQTVILKELPAGHPARADLDRSLLADIQEFSSLASPPQSHLGEGQHPPKHVDAEPLAEEYEVVFLGLKASRGALVTGLVSVVMAVTTFVVTAIQVFGR